MKDAVEVIPHKSVFLSFLLLFCLQITLNSSWSFSSGTWAITTKKWSLVLVHCIYSMGFVGLAGSGTSIQKKYFLLTFVCCTQHAINVLILHLVMLLSLLIFFFLKVNSTVKYNYLHLGWVSRLKEERNGIQKRLHLKNYWRILK